ncbi:hypothetical protein [Streptomyces sp. NBC_01334]|uniref:hypothetical protein n=1 Tax=Streptomyces sp. NBC_01334 TaxID=2903827 RepID=UPI002E1036E8|nr:hypothetical protein OG736_01975 [Streptomyces sp. NBC_01334]
MALVDEFLRARESHSDGELIATPGRPTPFQERSPQQFNLVFREQFARRDTMF